MKTKLASSVTAFLVAVVALCFEVKAEDVSSADVESIIPPNVAVVRAQSNYPYRVQIKFFSKSYNRSWPGDNQAYGLKDSARHVFRLSCIEGEKICYGAWPDGNTTVYWGVGNDGQACEKCCFQCGSERSYNLN
ncbi:hypothetical protein [Methylobacterium sp. WL7]|uniref:hypothetical protein n=1 Tax=Methylobacterium sp. WL7 TaxID=2603900 RepID=UPI0011CA500A|nr:hypothetical protein [Methylobacterium sp. WL7]TXN42917.1 hypothetical protein FV233_20675 [Methylobacterium sp. WL7]